MHIRNLFFYQKTLKDGDMKVTWMQYKCLLVQRLDRIKCINSNFSEVLSSLIVLDLESLALINAAKEWICLRFYIYPQWYVIYLGTLRIMTDGIVRVSHKWLLYKKLFAKISLQYRTSKIWFYLSFHNRQIEEWHQRAYKNIVDKFRQTRDFILLPN